MQVDDEHERLVGPDHAAGALAAVGLARRDHDAAPAADLHAGHALVPALDDLAAAEPEAERVAAVPAGVELLAGAPRHADVVDLDLRAGGGLVAVADLDVLDLELRGRGLAGRDVHMGLLVAHADEPTRRRSPTLARHAPHAAAGPPPPSPPGRPRRRAGGRLVLAPQRRPLRPRGAGPARGGERLRGRVAGPHRRAPGRAVRRDEGPHQGDRPSVPYRKGARWFYSRTEEGQQYPILCRTSVEPPTDLPDGTPMPGEEITLDLNVLAGDSDYFALGAYDLAPRPGPAPLLHRPRRLGALHDARSATCAPATTSPT